MIIDYIRYWFLNTDLTESSFWDWLKVEAFEIYRFDMIRYAPLFHFVLWVACVVVVEINIFLFLDDLFDKGGFNMKKITSFLAIALLVILCVPSVPALADEPSDIMCYTSESVSDYFSGSIGETDKQDIADLIYRVPNTFVTSDVVSALNNFPSDPNNGNSSPLTSGYWFAAVNSNLSQLAVYWPLESFNNVDIDWSAASPLLTVNGTGEICFNACFTETDPDARYYMMVSYYNLNTHTWGNPTGYLMTQTNDTDHIFYFKIYNTYNTGRPNFILSASDTLHYLYSSTEYQYFSQTTGTVNHTNFLMSIYQGIYNYTNYLPVTLPYYDGESIVVPDDGDNVESNENHMYFTNCNFGFCEPSNVNSFSNFGGAYFYIDYDVDQWVRDHISDYKIEFHVDCYVGADHFSFTTHQVLDPDMCLTIPFSYFDGFSYGFSSYVTNQRIDSTFLKSYLYCVAPNSYTEFYNKLSSGSFGGTLSNALNNLVYSISGSLGVLVYTNPSLSTVISSSVLTPQFIAGLFYNNNFTITCSAKLQDNNQNESGSVARKFDLVRGSSTSEDNSGLTNEDPFVSDDEDEGYLPTLPDYTGTGTGSSGNGQVTVNNNMPSKLDVTIDNGFNQFMQTYNSSTEVQTAQNGFWGSFGLFKDNPATTLYQQYFGFLPDGFKEIVLGGACIGIIGGAFAALRKKLT